MKITCEYDHQLNCFILRSEDRSIEYGAFYLLPTTDDPKSARFEDADLSIEQSAWLFMSNLDQRSYTIDDLRQILAHLEDVIRDFGASLPMAEDFV